jgi:POT family proton-dependent oligopeptide transporter
MWESTEHKQDFFYMNFGLVLLAAFVLIVMLKWLNSVMKENNVQ